MQDQTYTLLYETELNHWWYKVRRKIVKRLINQYVNNENIKILDVGCGTGQLMKELKDVGEIYGIDFSVHAIDFCRKRGLVEVKQGSATSIPYGDNSFDVILALDLLEHVEDDHEAIKEMKRVVKDKGIFIIFVPAFNFLWGRSDEIGKHFRRYSKERLLKVIKQNDLEVLRFSYFNFILFLPIALIRLIIRILKIKIQSENNTKFGFINKMLYYIFLFESFMLQRTNFPFGVSMLVVCKK